MYCLRFSALLVLLLLLLVLGTTCLKQKAAARILGRASSPGAAAHRRPSSALPRTQVFFEGPGSIVVDMVSLFPTENVKEGEARGDMNPYPFRADLLGALKDLKPACVALGLLVLGTWYCETGTFQ